MEWPPTDFRPQNDGKNEGKPKVNSDFYINRDECFGCNSLSSLSVGNTTASMLARERFGGLEIMQCEDGDDAIDIDLGAEPLPVHLLDPDTECDENNTEDRSSVSSLTNELNPEMNRRARPSLFSKHLRQIQNSRRAQFHMEGIEAAFNGQDLTLDDDCPRNNGVQPWYSTQPNHFQNSNHNSDKTTPPLHHTISVGKPEKDVITSEEHICQLIRSPSEQSAYPISSPTDLNDSPKTIEQNGNGFLTYAYRRYSDTSRNKRITLLLFLFALSGGCFVVIAVVGAKKDHSSGDTNEKILSLEDITNQGGQLSLEESLQEFIDEEAYLRDGSDSTNITGVLSNSPSSSPTAGVNGETGQSSSPSLSLFSSELPSLPDQQQTTMSPTSKPSSSPITLSPSRQPSFRPTLMPSKQPSTRPQSPPSQIPTQKPTPQPTAAPTHKSSQQPTIAPTRRPSPRPTPKPTQITPRPSTEYPTIRPTKMPSSTPSAEPSKSPTQKAETLAPSGTPSLQPSSNPTQTPTTLAPSKAPTLKPSTTSPTNEPTWPPSSTPITSSPTSLPSDMSSTLAPSSSVSPTTKATSLLRSITPTAQPTTLEPSRRPTSSTLTNNPITYSPSPDPSIDPQSNRWETPTIPPTPEPSKVRLTSKLPTSTPIPTAAPQIMNAPTPAYGPTHFVASLDPTITTYAPTLT